MKLNSRVFDTKIKIIGLIIFLIVSPHILFIFDAYYWLIISIYILTAIIYFTVVSKEFREFLIKNQAPVGVFSLAIAVIFFLAGRHSDSQKVRALIMKEINKNQAVAEQYLAEGNITALTWFEYSFESMRHNFDYVLGISSQECIDAFGNAVYSMEMSNNLSDSLQNLTENLVVSGGAEEDKSLMTQIDDRLVKRRENAQIIKENLGKAVTHCKLK